MFLKGIACIFAIVLIAIGVLGFIPTITANHLLFNLFEIGFLNNLLYIFTGLIALSASGSAVYARLYFKFFGIVYALLAIFGFAMNGNVWILHVNMVDSFFHLIMGIIALYLGFTSRISPSLTYSS